MWKVDRLVEEVKNDKFVSIEGGTSRFDWINVLRAFAVFCIVLGHTLRNATVVYPWLYCFHVPLCVLTSGIVFHHGKRTFANFLKNKFFTLLVPYYFFASISIVLYALLGDMMEKAVEGGYNVTLIDSILGMLYANSGNGLMRWNMPLWYLPMLFGLIVIAWPLFRDDRSTKTDWIILIGTIAVAFICYTFVRLDNLPLGFETAIYMLPFFSLGTIFKRYMKEIEKIPWWLRFMFGVALLCVGTLMSISVGQVSYNADNYGANGYIYFYLMSGSLCVGFTLLATSIKKRQNGSVMWGKTRLV